MVNLFSEQKTYFKVKDLQQFMDKNDPLFTGVVFGYISGVKDALVQSCYIIKEDNLGSLYASVSEDYILMILKKFFYIKSDLSAKEAILNILDDCVLKKTMIKII